MATRALGKATTATLLAIVALLTGCAARPPARLADTPPPIAAPIRAPRPVPPAGASADAVLPALGGDGEYQTINRNLSSSAAVWHVRSALNVAALGCRGANEATIIAGYNMMLVSKKAVLATSLARTEAEARATGGKSWRDAHDRHMTQVYNFFAQPPAKAAFCEAAAAVLAEAAATSPADFPAFAPGALARLEAPFIDFYRAFDAYRRDLAAWDAGDPAAGVRLVYAPMEGVLAWAPSRGAERTAMAAAGR